MQAERTAELLGNRIRKKLRKLRPWAKREGIECFRVFDRDIPEVPVAVDKYGEAVAMHVYVGKRPIPQGCIEAMVEATAQSCGVAKELVFWRKRERRVGGSAPQLGEGRGEEGAQRVVQEGGHRFKINLRDFLDVGLFLDHRVTRKMVGEESRGKKVLNLFSYTSSFSVYAAKGGAERTVSVDLSRRYLEWSAENFRLNNISEKHHELVQADVFEWLQQAQERFEMIVLDPPTISRSKKMEGDLDIQRDQVRLIQLCHERLSEGGVLYFSNNYQGFELNERAVRGMRCEEISEKTRPLDFQGKTPHRCFRIQRKETS